MKLSILMPVYNERTAVERCLAQVLSAPLPEEMKRELAPSGRRDESGDKRSLNKIDALSWWLYSRVLRASHISKIALKIFDKTVWIWRRVDPVLPWRGLSLILVARK
ncbi:MAG TPA: hypothetical protein VMT32_03140 [Bryobacteraceae bacterium]|nr:hypothetical protein [Bryobacteraceae bacterium]